MATGQPNRFYIITQLHPTEYIKIPKSKRTIRIQLPQNFRSNPIEQSILPFHWSSPFTLNQTWNKKQNNQFLHSTYPIQPLAKSWQTQRDYQLRLEWEWNQFVCCNQDYRTRGLTRKPVRVCESWHCWRVNSHINSLFVKLGVNSELTSWLVPDSWVWERVTEFKKRDEMTEKYVVGIQILSPN